MGKIISEAGEVRFVTRSVGTNVEGFVIIGTMGVWDAQVHLSYKEMLFAFGNPRTILAMLEIPIFLLKRMSKRKEKST